jgi:phage terminase large subunit GpA-like protein
MGLRQAAGSAIAFVGLAAIIVHGDLVALLRLDVNAGELYFKQLTAERLVTRIVKGFPRASWEKEPGRRNEALDCRVYARAAAAIYGLDRFDERHWRRMEEALARTVEHDGNEPAWARPLSVRPPARQVIHSGYMAR